MPEALIVLVFVGAAVVLAGLHHRRMVEAQDRAWTAVPPLLALERQVHPAESPTVRQAIERIQSRLRGAEAGQLSLVQDDERGRLALAAEAGRLSETEDEQRRSWLGTAGTWLRPVR